MFKRIKMKEKFSNMFKKEAIIGWVILLLGVWFIYLSIDPLINNRYEFIRIILMVVGGGLGSTALIMWILQKTLPTDSSPDLYEEWMDKEYKVKEPNDEE